MIRVLIILLALLIGWKAIYTTINTYDEYLGNRYFIICLILEAMLLSIVIILKL